MRSEKRPGCVFSVRISSNWCVSQLESSHRSPGWSWTGLWHCLSPWEHSWGPIGWFGWGEWAGWCGWCRLLPPSFPPANILSEKGCECQAFYQLRPESYLLCVSQRLWCVPSSSLTGKVHSWTRLSSTFRDSASTTDTSTPETRPCNVSSCMGKKKQGWHKGTDVHYHSSNMMENEKHCKQAQTLQIFLEALGLFYWSIHDVLKSCLCIKMALRNLAWGVLLILKFIYWIALTDGIFVLD